ncbi:MAG: single-stranded-DNA-specific exonuclease RecJ [Planctomycetota bacterium]
MSTTALEGTLNQPPADRGLTRRWIPRREPAAQDAALALTDRVLAGRGLGDEAAREAFCSPSLLGLHDPSLIPGLDRAAERILAAARAGEPIVIFGDYDVDGVTASTILLRMLRAIAPDADATSYIPHRLDEGYGLNADALRALAADGARVIVTVDCGITATAEADLARELGVDLIITDHHNPPASERDVPRAFSVVHPRLPGSAYPFGELCGAGVAYKLAWRLATIANGSDKVAEPMRRLLIDLLALCALGVIADVVPLVDENRIIARHGLSRCANSPIIGLRALVEASRLESDKIDAEAVGFRLAPRLNACGRMGHARDALRLFTTDDPAEAASLAQMLSEQNEQRRSVERRILEEAVAAAEAAGMTSPDKRIIILASEGWHPGVVGIVCSRLVERFGRPAVLLNADGPIAAGTALSGSGRSIDGFNLHGALDACAEHLAGFGGHDMAAGLRLDASNLDALTDALLAHAAERIAEDDLLPAVRYDTEAELAELHRHEVERLESLSPFGRGNPRVRVLVRGLRLTGRPEAFGRTGQHLSLRVTSEGGPTLRCIMWSGAELLDAIPPGATIDAVLTPKLSTWNGSTRVEPELSDLRVANA